jgi:hypothetical protein
LLVGHTEDSFMDEVAFDNVLRTWDKGEGFKCGHNAGRGQDGEVRGGAGQFAFGLVGVKGRL